MPHAWSDIEDQAEQLGLHAETLEQEHDLDVKVNGLHDERCPFCEEERERAAGLGYVIDESGQYVSPDKHA